MLWHNFTRQKKSLTKHVYECLEKEDLWRQNGLVVTWGWDSNGQTFLWNEEHLQNLFIMRVHNSEFTGDLWTNQVNITAHRYYKQAEWRLHDSLRGMENDTWGYLEWRDVKANFSWKQDLKEFFIFEIRIK